MKDFFEPLSDLILLVGNPTKAYPPHNIIGMSETAIRIELAVAGFAKEELIVEQLRGELVIKGNPLDDTNVNYLHKGISTRKFKYRFKLDPGISIESANLENGLLVITLVYKEPVPEKVKIG